MSVNTIPPESSGFKQKVKVLFVVLGRLDVQETSGQGTTRYQKGKVSILRLRTRTGFSRTGECIRRLVSCNRVGVVRY